MLSPAVEPVVEIAGLGKSYGRVRALEELTLGVSGGEILGFLGPNGAGKTTTIRLLLGLLRPSSGSATVFGLDCWSDSVSLRRRVGYLAGDVRLYDALTGRGCLELLGRLRGRPVSYEPLAERLRLDLDRRIKGYSKGMKQKLGLIQALMHDPELLILDEPTAALDPLVQEEVYAILEERRRGGTTIFFSSHILSEVEKVCDRVAIIRGGRLLAVQEVEEIQGLGARRVRATFTDPASGLAALRATGEEVHQDGSGRIELTVRGAIDPVVKVLARQQVSSLTVEPLSLEDIFFEFYRDG